MYIATYIGELQVKNNCVGANGLACIAERLHSEMSWLWAVLDCDCDISAVALNCECFWYTVRE